MEIKSNKKDFFKILKRKYKSNIKFTSTNGAGAICVDFDNNIIKGTIRIMCDQNNFAETITDMFINENKKIVMDLIKYSMLKYNVTIINDMYEIEIFTYMGNGDILYDCSIADIVQEEFSFYYNDSYLKNKEQYGVSTENDLKMLLSSLFSISNTYKGRNRMYSFNVYKIDISENDIKSIIGNDQIPCVDSINFIDCNIENKEAITKLFQKGTKINI